LELKLNIGCGTDTREDFINIDGSSELSNLDYVIDLSKESITNFFESNSIDFILMNDFIEHHFRWEACKILTDCYTLLKLNGILELRTPDIELIINSNNLTIEQKILSIYGGQNIPFGSNIIMNKSRTKFPQFFCHKYCWEKEKLKQELLSIGFKNINITNDGQNYIINSQK